jgi:hypothetical protein
LNPYVDSTSYTQAIQSGNGAIRHPIVAAFGSPVVRCIAGLASYVYFPRASGPAALSVKDPYLGAPKKRKYQIYSVYLSFGI